MKIQKKVSMNGEFCKIGEDVKDGDVVKILDSGTVISGDYGDRHAFKIDTTNGEKILSFNQTSLNNLVDAIGDETENWKGKEIKVFIVKQMVSGKLRNIAYLTGKDWTMLDDGTFMPAKEDLNELEYPAEDE